MLRMFLAALLLMGASATSAQTMFRCKTPNGTTSFQQAPCDGDRNGAITVKPGNTVDGNPAGERGTRVHASRSLDARIAAEKAAAQSTRRPSRTPCYSELQIRNAETEASSVTTDRRRSSDLRDKARSMRACRQ